MTPSVLREYIQAEFENIREIAKSLVESIRFFVDECERQVGGYLDRLPKD